MTIKNVQKLYILLILTGLLGVFLFFPVNLDSRYTCLFHRMFTENSRSHSMERINSQSDSELIHRYIVPFGFLWWSSIGLVALGIRTYKVRGKKQKPESRKESV